MAGAGREIERKFLVDGEGWRDAADDGEEIAQGYLHVDDDGEVRVRIRGDEAVLTVKRGGHALDRREVEVPLVVDDARTLLDEAVVGVVLRKRRHLVELGGDLVAEIDEFAGEHEGLVIAEVELPDVDTPVPEVAWLGEEVTGDERYYNARLATDP